MNWTLDQLKSELNGRKEVKGWVLAQEHVQRRERYFLSDQGKLAVDQDRDVKRQNLSVRLFVNLPGKPGRQGEITKKVFPALPLKNQIDSALEAAMQTDHQSWELSDDAPDELPQLATADPKIAEDINAAMTELTGQISEVVSKKSEASFNSAELFLSVHDRELHLSNGLVHRSSQSRIYTEAAYSVARTRTDGKIQSDEYMNTRWSVSLKDLELEQIFGEASSRAANSLDVKKPATGKYAVIIDAEVLNTLLNGFIRQLSAKNSYHGLPFRKPGDELIPGATGDLLSIRLDPHLEYGADTTAVSSLGERQIPLDLVQANCIRATLSDKQYADYLGATPTTIRGSVVIPAGKLNHRQLTQEAPRVIEILQFSGLFADPNSGTFGSEIRLAKLHDNVKGTVSYLKGGSLSGNIIENFRGLRLSDRAVKRSYFESSGDTPGEGYFGPEFALLTDVSVVG